jgi:YD repeat-containing protein
MNRRRAQCPITRTDARTSVCRSAKISASLAPARLLDKRLTVTDPANSLISVIDAAGEQTGVTDPMGNFIDYDYTPRGQLADEYILISGGLGPQKPGAVGAASLGSPQKFVFWAATRAPCGCISSITQTAIP